MNAKVYCIELTVWDILEWKKKFLTSEYGTLHTTNDNKSLVGNNVR